MPLKPYTIEEIETIIDHCILPEDRMALSYLASTIAEDGNLYSDMEIVLITEAIENKIKRQ